MEALTALLWTNMLFFVTTRNAAPTWTRYALSRLRNVDIVCKPNTVAASTHSSSRRRIYKLCALAILIADIAPAIGCRQTKSQNSYIYGRQSCKLKVWHDCVNAVCNQAIWLLLWNLTNMYTACIGQPEDLTLMTYCLQLLDSSQACNWNLRGWQVCTISGQQSRCP